MIPLPIMQPRRTKATDASSDIEGGGGLVKNQSKSYNLQTILVNYDKTVPLLVFCWYTAAVVSITTSKKVMNIVPLPFLLCTSQFLSAWILTRVVGNMMSVYKPLQPSCRPLVYKIAVAFSLGFILTNCAFSRTSAAFAETIKATEPISSVILGYIYYAEVLTWQTYVCLVPVCIGVATSCYSDDNFDMLGFIFAASSNIGFSCRAVFAKLLSRQHPDALDEVSLFTHVSFIGLMILLPCCLIFEGGEIYRVLDEGVHYIDILVLLLINGIAYATYNLMSFMVMMRVNIVTHAVLNVFRRVFIIIITSIYFGNELSWINLGGIFIAVIGVLCFSIFRKEKRNVPSVNFMDNEQNKD